LCGPARGKGRLIIVEVKERKRKMMKEKRTGGIIMKNAPNTSMIHPMTLGSCIG
jgi:hypothetical protein